MDETFSGAFASAPNLALYFRLIGSDVNGPLYYLLLRPWSAVFGLSDWGLRSLSLVLSAGAPLAVAFAPLRGLSRSERLTWAAMVALWIPGVGYSQAAKPLALALFLATLQTISFADLLRQRRPSTRSAALWVGLSALAIEAHYDVAYVALAQGFIYLALRRSAAVRTWPAIVLLTPVVFEIGRKAALLVRLTTPGSAWYHLVQFKDLPEIGAYVLGGWLWFVAYPVLIVCSWFLGRRDEPAEANEAMPALTWTAFASFFALAAFVVVGAVRPSFDLRYLGPFTPGILLGVLLAVRVVARGQRWIAFSTLVVLTCAFVAGWLAIGAPRGDSGFENLNFEQASESLMRSGVRQVVFAWDNPVVRGMPDDEAELVGGFFFRRARAPISVTPVHIGSDDDPNQVFLRTAGPGRDAILWVYDRGVAGTAAIRHPPRIAALDPNYVCRNYGRMKVGVVTCVDRRFAR
jgi:hypothetical protein